MAEYKEIRAKYVVILRNSFHRLGEEPYFRVFELGKQMVLDQVEPDMLIDIHGAALK